MSSVKRYEVNGSSSFYEDEKGSFVDYEDYAALEAKCAALSAELKQSQIDASCYKKGMEASNERLVQVAAENAALKEWSPNPHSASMFEAIEKAEALMDDGMPELAMVEAFEILKMKRTPVTDSFLAEVRASGVEAAIATAKNVVAQEFQYKDFETVQRVCSKFPESDLVGKVEMVEWLEDFAAQLRQGGERELSNLERNVLECAAVIAKDRERGGAAQ